MMRMVLAVVAGTVLYNYFSTPRDQLLYAIADVHGDFPRFAGLLRHAGVIDASNNWIAKSATLVQTGDIVDRGPDTRKIYKFMRQLTFQAHRQGGKVIKLWGNHEFMNVMEDWRYVDDEDIASFGGNETRRAAFKRGGEVFEDWMDYSVSHRDHIFKAHFIHAGLTPQWARRDINGIGRRFMDTLADDAKWTSEQHAFWSETGPMWYRGFATLPEHEACEVARTVMATLKVEYLVMGHTPNFEGIVTRCDKRVLLIDTGISSAYGGRPGLIQFSKVEGKTQVGVWYDDGMELI